QSLVDAAAEKALAPWRRRKEAQRAIDRAIEDLPSGARPSWGKDTPWSAQARTAATGAVARLPEAADTRAVKAAVAQPVAPIQTGFERQQACEQMVKDTWMHLSGWNNEELEQGQEAVAAALAELHADAGAREREP